MCSHSERYNTREQQLEYTRKCVCVWPLSSTINLILLLVWRQTENFYLYFNFDENSGWMAGWLAGERAVKQTITITPPHSSHPIQFIHNFRWLVIFQFQQESKLILCFHFREKPEKKRTNNEDTLKPNAVMENRI